MWPIDRCCQRSLDQRYVAEAGVPAPATRASMRPSFPTGTIDSFPLQHPTHLQDSPLFNLSFTVAVSLRHIHNHFGLARVYVNCSDGTPVRESTAARGVAFKRLIHLGDEQVGNQDCPALFVI